MIAERRAGVLLLSGVLWLGHGCATIIANTFVEGDFGPEFEVSTGSAIRDHIVEGRYFGTAERAGRAFHAYEFSGVLDGEKPRFARVLVPVVPAEGPARQVYFTEVSGPDGAPSVAPAWMQVVGCEVPAAPPAGDAVNEEAGSFPAILRLRVCKFAAAEFQVAWGPSWALQPAILEIADTRRKARRASVASFRTAAPFIDGAVVAGAIMGCAYVVSGGKVK